MCLGVVALLRHLHAQCRNNLGSEELDRAHDLLMLQTTEAEHPDQSVRSRDCNHLPCFLNHRLWAAD